MSRSFIIEQSQNVESIYVGIFAEMVQSLVLDFEILVLRVSNRRLKNHGILMASSVLCHLRVFVFNLNTAFIPHFCAKYYLLIDSTYWPHTTYLLLDRQPT